MSHSLIGRLGPRQEQHARRPRARAPGMAWHGRAAAIETSELQPPHGSERGVSGLPRSAQSSTRWRTSSFFASCWPKVAAPTCESRVQARRSCPRSGYALWRTSWRGRNERKRREHRACVWRKQACVRPQLGLANLSRKSHVAAVRGLRLGGCCFGDLPLGQLPRAEQHARIMWPAQLKLTPSRGSQKMRRAPCPLPARPAAPNPNRICCRQRPSVPARSTRSTRWRSVTKARHACKARTTCTQQDCEAGTFRPS